jgi:hypothetical protein
MHRPQLQRRVLFTPADQLMQKHRRIQTAAEGHQKLAMGVGFAQYRASSS